jgi:hypothetical protein
MNKPSFLHAIAAGRAMAVAALLAAMLAAALMMLDTHAVHPGQVVLDGLRLRASGGDWDASRSLTRLLFDRYDRTKDSEDLFEAMLWLDMDWDSPTPEHTQLQSRVFDRYCSHRVLRWHWLCRTGE